MLDFIKLCEEFNIPHLESGHHHCHEGWIQTHCPFCTDGSYGWHLGFSIEKGNMNCWSCGSHHVYKFLSIVLQNKGVSVKQILKLYGKDRNIIPKKKAKPRPRKAKKPPPMESLSKVHRRYLKQRNFNPTKLTQEWNLDGTKGLSGEWSWRVITPIFNKSHMIIGYAGRALHPDTRPKWKFSNNKDMSEDPKKMIYGIEKIRDMVLIMEGIPDVWRMGIGSVSIMGIDWKIEQAFILKDFKYRFIMFDPEPKAQKQAQKLAAWLAPFPGETEIISGLKTDPGDLSQEEANKFMNELGF